MLPLSCRPLIANARLYTTYKLGAKHLCLISTKPVRLDGRCARIRQSETNRPILSYQPTKQGPGPGPPSHVPESRIVHPLSGQLSLKHVGLRSTKYAYAWRLFSIAVEARMVERLLSSFFSCQNGPLFALHFPSTTIFYSYD